MFDFPFHVPADDDAPGGKHHADWAASAAEIRVLLQNHEFRVGVAEPLITAEHPTPVHALKLGDDVREKLPSRLSRTMMKHMDPEWLAPKLEAPPSGSSWVPSLSEHYALLPSLLAFSEKTKALADKGHPLAIAEHDNAKKICAQSGGVPGWAVQPEGLIRDVTFPFTPIVKAVLDAMDWSASKEPNPFRRGTNHGAPSWATDDVDALGHVAFALAAGSFDRAQALYPNLANRLEHAVPPVSTIGSRTGPIAKSQPIHSLWAGEMHRLGTVNGLACRRRTIFMVPFWTYALIRPAYARVVGALRATRFAAGAVGLTELEARIGAWYARAREDRVWNDDISGFDQSVPYSLQVAIKLALCERLPPALHTAIDAWFATEQMPVIGPPLRAGATAFIYKSKGMTKSGNLFTSVMGSIINLVRIAWCWHRTFGGTIAAAARHACQSGDVLGWGDDTLFLAPRNLSDADRRMWETASLECGFTAKLLPGAVLLRRYFLAPTGQSVALVSRVLQQTLYNEHPSQTTALELLGLRVRSEGVEANPFWGGVNDVFYANAKNNEALAHWGITTHSQMKLVTESAAFKRRVIEDAKRSNNLFVLAREGATAQPGSPAARKWAIIAALVGRGDAEAQLLDLDQLHDLVRAEVPGSLMELAYHCMYAGVHGHDAALELPTLPPLVRAILKGGLPSHATPTKE